MWYDELFTKMEGMKDEGQGLKMSAYMQNLFPFIGIKKPELNKCMQPYLKAAKKLPIDWQFIDLCWSKPYREAQYVALNYLDQHVKELSRNDINKIKKLIVEKSWWETVDQLDAVIGAIALKEPEVKTLMIEWSTDENIWLRRVAIDFQQEYKDETDTKLLEEIIVNNLNSNEFFINKAIGWSLRDYSKINPLWVGDFFKKYDSDLSALSKKEASKYL